jgi:hypothetical protein
VDKELQDHYEQLLSLYVWPDPAAITLKKIVLMRASENRRVLRPDATYFLLINLTQMILLPYAGLTGLPSPKPYRDYSVDKVFNNAQKTIDILFSDFGLGHDEVSSHEILVAIHRNWSSLAELWGWA